MKERTITLAEAQQLLEHLGEHFIEETLVITHNDQPALTLMSYQAHQELLANVASLQTLLEIMLGGEKAETPRPAKTTVLVEKHTSWEEFKSEVGWE
jgi:hypothetical protein